ncbi:hypothetical protein ON010_g9276 [Phytophthora cinnamomi]|nr:hypothetical protein ON010_g9276 [Phytophthora cinnamomi]
MDQGKVLYNATADEGLVTLVPWRQAVSALLYRSPGTRPDIAYVVNQVGSDVSNTSVAHWNVVKKIFRYISTTRGTSLRFQRNEGAALLRLYLDANWANNTEWRKTLFETLLEGPGSDR